MYFKQEGIISALSDHSLKLVDYFTFLGSNVLFTESDINICIGEVWTAINRKSIEWESDLSNKMKQEFFQVRVASVLLYGCTTKTLTKLLKNVQGLWTIGTVG